MASINIGSLKFNWKGTYNGSTAYAVDDVTEYNGSSYICILASTGNLPTNTTYFQPMATKGTDGTDVGTTLTTQGDILYRDGSGLQRLAAGTNGQALLTGGAGANVSWGNVSDNYSTKLIHISSDTQSTTTTSSWTKMPLDTVRTNEITGASLSNGQVTLPAGTYICNSKSVAYRNDGFNHKIRNVTDGADVVMGQGGHCWNASYDATTSHNTMFGKFTIAAQKVFEMQYYIDNSNSQTSGGTGSNRHPNHFIMWKTA